jgi:catechol 2,3-dioxygenase-like lactoylglutathione lyase family enzyme
MPDNLALEHPALSVASLERSIAFYRDVLGLELQRIIEVPDRPRLGEVVNIPGCAARIAHLQSGPVILELLEYIAPRGRPVPPDRTQADLGFTHIGFASKDIHADYARLRRMGVVFYNEPIEYRPGVWNAYFFGPDGETCEMRQSLQQQGSPPQGMPG